MGRTILVNVGTSLLTNEPNATDLKQIYDKVKQFLQEFNNNFNEVNLKKNTYYQEIYNKVKEYFSERKRETDKTKPPFRYISAEINSLKAMEQNNLLSKDDEVVLILTETWDGYLCGKILEEYYVDLKLYCDTIIVPGLQVFDAKKFRTEGMPNYVKIIANYWLEKKDIIINATGGFKALIPYAILLGSILKIKVIYLFENSTELIIFPPLNIDWDLSVWDKHSDILKEINENRITLDDIREKLSEEDYIKFLPLIDINENNIISLSTLGILYYEASTSKKPIQLETETNRIIPIKKAKEHPTIWSESHRGKHELNLSDLPEHIQSLFKKLMEVKVVKEIILGDFDGRSNYSGESMIRLLPFDSKQKGKLNAKIYDREGELNKYQNLSIQIENGYEKMVYDYFRGIIKNER
jgi:putative CRISPR-associated protein (TIGR02619 family)